MIVVYTLSPTVISAVVSFDGYKDRILQTLLSPTVISTVDSLDDSKDRILHPLSDRYVDRWFVL